MPLKVHPLIWLLIAAVGALLATLALIPSDPRSWHLELFRVSLSLAAVTTIGAWGALSRWDLLLRMVVMLGGVVACTVVVVGFDQLVPFSRAVGFFLFESAVTFGGYMLLRLGGWRLVGEDQWRSEEEGPRREEKLWQFSVWNLMTITVVVGIVLGIARHIEWKDSVSVGAVFYGTISAFPPGLAFLATLFIRSSNAAIRYLGWIVALLALLAAVLIVCGDFPPIDIMIVAWVASGLLASAAGVVVRLAGYHLEHQRDIQKVAATAEAPSGQGNDPV